jgi:hypothetical protein
MSESDKTPKATCGSVILMGALAGLVVYAQRGYFHADAPPNWGATAAAAVAVVAAFVTQRRIQNIFAGLAAAALLTAHPTWWLQPEGGGLDLLAEAVVPAVGACVAVGWRLVFHPRFAWRMWPVVTVALAGCEGLALASDGRQGFYALVLAPAGLLAGAGLAVALRNRAIPTDRPSPLNPPAALLVAVAATVGGVLLGHFLRHLPEKFDPDKLLALQMPDLSFPKLAVAWELIVRRLDGPYVFSADAFRGGHAAWAWPHPYVTLPILAYALWRTVRRGAIQWTRKQPPCAWLLSLAAVAVPTLLAVRPGDPAEQTPLVPLSLVVALVVFLPIDLMQGLAERLVLRPPAAEDAPNSVAGSAR